MIDSHVHYTIIVIVYKHDQCQLSKVWLWFQRKQKGREHWRVFGENKEQFVVTLGFDIKNKIYERQ